MKNWVTSHVPVSAFQSVIDVPSRPLTIAELCEWLGVSRRYVEGQVATGKLRVRKISSRLVRVMPSDAARWLDRAATEVDA
jgi:excisionase family DNA binding protein